MDGIQKTVCEGLKHLANKVEEGFYGINDDAFQEKTNREVFLDDLDDEVTGKMD